MVEQSLYVDAVTLLTFIHLTSVLTFTISKPTPRLPPVTSMTFPDKSGMSSTENFERGGRPSLMIEIKTPMGEPEERSKEPAGDTKLRTFGRLRKLSQSTELSAMESEMNTGVSSILYTSALCSLSIIGGKAAQWLDVLPLQGPLIGEITFVSA